MNPTSSSQTLSPSPQKQNPPFIYSVITPGIQLIHSSEENNLPDWAPRPGDSELTVVLRRELKRRNDERERADMKEKVRIYYWKRDQIWKRAKEGLRDVQELRDAGLPKSKCEEYARRLLDATLFEVRELECEMNR